jgi:type I restriction-modification system DNA methylase subunit
MSASTQQKLGNTLWAIADQLRGAMNADGFPQGAFNLQIYARF